MELSRSDFSVVEVIKQVEPGPLMPTAKPRVQAEVFTPKSPGAERVESDSVAGL